jgi:ribonuclease HI
MGRHPIANSFDPTGTLNHVLRWVADENRSRCWPALHLTIGKHLRYVLRLHFSASNNVAEYEALVNGLRIAIELGVRRLDARGDSQLVIDQVMKNSHYRDRKMEAYCDEVRRLEDKFYGLELNHIAR